MGYFALRVFLWVKAIINRLKFFGFWSGLYHMLQVVNRSIANAMKVQARVPCRATCSGCFGVPLIVCDVNNAYGVH